MLYEKALRSKTYLQDTVKRISDLKLLRQVKVMEVCGTHTYSFFRFGLREIFSSFVDLISGPGCPVCITTNSYINKAIHLSKDRKNMITTFGDLLRVRGDDFSLEEARAEGADVNIVYSPLDALELARKNKRKRVIFLSVGFETTAPLSAATAKKAKEEKINNFYLLCGNRIIPPAMDILCQDKEINIEGFICPGHVSAVIGIRPYEKIVKKYQKGCVIAGFEPLDMAISLYQLLKQIKENNFSAQNAYARVVRAEGNVLAQDIIKEVFTIEDAPWRGLGIIKKSGLFLKKNFKQFDAENLINREIGERKIPPECLCSEVIKGKVRPPKCPQFKNKCTPFNPLGPCMVSFEGTCRIYYEYSG